MLCASADSAGSRGHEHKSKTCYLLTSLRFSVNNACSTRASRLICTSRKGLNLMNKLDAGYLAFLNSVYAVDYSLQSTSLFLIRKRLELVFVKQPLSNLEPLLGILLVFGLCISFEGSLPIDRLVEHCE